MAMSTSSETGGSGAGFRDFLFGAADLAIKYEQAKRTDVETTQNNNVPDVADEKYNNERPARSDTLGGAFSRQYYGMSGGMWLGVGVLALIGSGVALRALK